MSCNETTMKAEFNGTNLFASDAHFQKDVPSGKLEVKFSKFKTYFKKELINHTGEIDNAEVFFFVCVKFYIKKGPDT